MQIQRNIMAVGGSGRSELHMTLKGFSIMFSASPSLVASQTL